MKHVRYQRRLIANMEKGDDDLGAFIKLSKKKRKNPSYGVLRPEL